MKRKTAVLLASLFLAAMTAMTWVMIPVSVARENEKISELLSKAENYENRKMYIDSLECYLGVLAVRRNDHGILLKAAELYLRLGDDGSFVTYCGYAADADPGDPKAYVLLLEYYSSRGNVAEALEVLSEAERAGAACSEFVQYRELLKNRCEEIWVSLEDAGDWHLFRGGYAAPAKSDGKWGIISSTGEKILTYDYDWVGAADAESGLIPVRSGDDLYYVDTKGDCRLSTEIRYSYLGPFGNGLAPACRDGIWGYIDREGREHHFEFDYAGAFSNGIAAVEKDGKWALVSDRFSAVTRFEYDGFLLDSGGFAAEAGKAVAEKEGLFYIIGRDGAVVAGGFDWAALPLSGGEPVAVKIDGQWGFASEKGSVSLFINCVEASSFSQGLAAILTEEGWIYIDEEGKPAQTGSDGKSRPPVSADSGCRSFSPDGAAFVFDGYAFNIIRLCRYGF